MISVEQIDNIFDNKIMTGLELFNNLPQLHLIIFDREDDILLAQGLIHPIEEQFGIGPLVKIVVFYFLLFDHFEQLPSGLFYFILEVDLLVDALADG